MKQYSLVVIGGALFPHRELHHLRSPCGFAECDKEWIILFDCASPHIYYIFTTYCACTKYSTSKVGPGLRSGATVRVRIRVRWNGKSGEGAYERPHKVRSKRVCVWGMHVWNMWSGSGKSHMHTTGSVPCILFSEAPGKIFVLKAILSEGSICYPRF